MNYLTSLLAFALAILLGISATHGDRHTTGFVHDNARVTTVVEALQLADDAEKTFSYEAAEHKLHIELKGTYQCITSPISPNPPLPATVMLRHGKYIINELKEKDQVISPTTSSFAKIESMEHRTYTCKNDKEEVIHIVRSDVNMEYDFTMDFIYQLLDNHYRRAFISGDDFTIVGISLPNPDEIVDPKVPEY